MILTLSVFPAEAKYGKKQLNNLRDLAFATSEDSLLRHGEWSVFVMDVESGRILLDINGDKSLAPASNLKLITTAAALKILGEEHQFETKLGHTGEITEGILAGDLVIVGGGDPTLGSSQVRHNADVEGILTNWAAAIQKAGIARIEGNIIADESYFDPIGISDGWLWIDIGNYYGAGVSALNFNDNLYHLFFKPGRNVGDFAEVLYTKPQISEISFLNYMKTGPVGSGDNGYIYGAKGGTTRTLLGTIPAGVAEFSIKGSLPDPALLCARALRQTLQNSGISISGDIRVTHESQILSGVIERTFSSMLKEIVYWLNKLSINLYADALLKQLGKSQHGEGSYAKGARAIKDLFQELEIPTAGMHLYDGSGLSPLDAITTRQMTLLLRSTARDASFRSFYDSFPIAGVNDDSGHMRHIGRGTAAEGNLRAKTGFISRVRAHSGYVNTKSGRLLCFSIIANDHIGSSRQIDRLHERIMVKLAELE